MIRKRGRQVRVHCMLLSFASARWARDERVPIQAARSMRARPQSQSAACDACESSTALSIDLRDGGRLREQLSREVSNGSGREEADPTENESLIGHRPRVNLDWLPSLGGYLWRQEASAVSVSLSSTARPRLYAPPQPDAKCHPRRAVSRRLSPAE